MRIIVLLFILLINYSLNSQLKFPTDVQQAYLLSYKIENAFNNAEYHKCINLLIQKKNLQAPYNEFDYLYYSKTLVSDKTF
jgi:hypothetical protein